jgi:hypothetical protein
MPLSLRIPDTGQEQDKGSPCGVSSLPVGAVHPHPRAHGPAWVREDMMFKARDSIYRTWGFAPEAAGGLGGPLVGTELGERGPGPRRKTPNREDEPPTLN